jgi:hypothetical protein
MSPHYRKPLTGHLAQLLEDFRIALRLLESYGPPGIAAAQAPLVGDDGRIIDTRLYAETERDEDALFCLFDDYQWLFKEGPKQ